MYVKQKMQCTMVIQTLLARLNTNPCKKYLPPALLAITQAQKMKISSQKAGSIFSGINDRVAKAIINPKKDNCKISFQFMIIRFLYKCNKYLPNQMICN